MAYFLSQLAEEDIGEICDFIAGDKPSAAMRFHTELHRIFGLLSVDPHLGKIKPHWGKGLRCLPLGKYLIIYTPEDAGVVILRVMHGARRIRKKDIH